MVILNRPLYVVDASDLAPTGVISGSGAAFVEDHHEFSSLSSNVATVEALIEQMQSIADIADQAAISGAAGPVQSNSSMDPAARQIAELLKVVWFLFVAWAFLNFEIGMSHGIIPLIAMSLLSSVTGGWEAK